MNAIEKTIFDTLAAGRGKAQAGEVLRDLREFERVESAAVDHGCS